MRNLSEQWRISLSVIKSECSNEQIYNLHMKSWLQNIFYILDALCSEQ